VGAAAPTCLQVGFTFRSETVLAVRVLVVEDKVKLATLLSRGLRKAGLSADVSVTGEDAIWMAAATPYDAVILDVMLPGIDGFETCRRLRSEAVWAPILMLTARDGIDDRVTGLDSGADDYLTKPFSLRELLARLRALMRRGAAERPAVIRAGDLQLDPASRRVWRRETEILLSQKEFAILEALMRRAGCVLSRLDLLDAAWDQSYENRSNIVDAYMRRLRQKVDRPFGADTLETVRGSGYRLREELP
jgi:two-component system OmpR family response regulator